MSGRPANEIIPGFSEDTLTLTTRELSDKYGVAESTIRDWRLWIRRNTEFQVGYGDMSFVDIKPKLDIRSDEELWQLLSRVSGKRDEERRAQDHLTIEFKDSLPHGIALTGDWHIGVEGVLYDELDEDLTSFAGIPGLYVLGMGDYAHNPKTRMRAGESLYRMVIPDPDQQYRMALYQMQKLAGQWIGLLKGCHDDWDSSLAGHERVVGLCNELDTAFLGHGATITVKLGSQEYHILARHRYKYESSINLTNAQRRAWEQIGQPDAVVFGHLHHTVAHKEPRGDKDVVYMRSGSYFKWDEFGMKIGHYQGQRGIPVLLLYPDEHKVIPFSGSDMKEAVRILESERSHYRR